MLAKDRQMEPVAFSLRMAVWEGGHLLDRHFHTVRPLWEDLVLLGTLDQVRM
jgi:hypothetical protein